MDIILWIDDEREAPSAATHTARTSREAIEILANMKEDDVLVLISFDHDLGYPDGSYDDVRPVVLWMLENEVFPEMAFVHSHNPVGARWIRQQLERYTDVTVQAYNPKNYG